MDHDTTLNDLFPSKYLKASDISGIDQVVTILSVDIEQVGFDKENKLVASLAEFPNRKFILNKTNADTIGKLYGNRPAGWLHKQLTLFVMEVAYQGKTTLGIRIRDMAPQPKRQTPPTSINQEFNPGTPEEPEFDTSR